jgi:mono/diheme cytochrome c family protein
MKALTSALCVGGILTTLGFASSRGPADEPSLAAQAHGILKQHCYQCHGDMGSAKGGMGFILDRDRLVQRGKLVPGDIGDSEIFQRIQLGEMPPPKQPRLKPDEVALLKKWIEAGAPAVKTPAAKREFVTEAQINNWILADLEAMPPKQGKFFRYFTLANLHNAGRSDADLDAGRIALGKLLNSLSWHPKIGLPRSVGTALFRIDLRHYKWAASTWERVLREYPYRPVTVSLEAKQIAQWTGTDVAVLRADWFVATASRPPLYHDLLQVPPTDRALERLLQVDVIQNLKDENVVRAGFNDSGVSKNNRLIERHDAVFGAYWRSYDFADNKDRQNLFEHPLGPANGATSFKHAGGEMIYHLPNGLQGYMIVDGQGRRIDKAPVEIVSDPLRPDQRVEPAISCMSCHAKGLIAKADQVREHVVKNNQAFAVADVNAVLALYPKNQVQKLVAQDNERYLKALAKLAVTVDAPDPVGLITRHYEGTLILADAAAEVGLSEAEFKKRLAKAPELARFLGPLLVKGGTIQRQVFQDAFGDIALALADKTVGTPIAKVVPLGGFSGSIQCVVFHPDGLHAAAGGDDRVLRLWDVQTGKELRQFRGHKDEITAVAFSPRGLWTVTGSRDRTVRLWDTETGDELAVWTGHTERVRCVAFSPDGWYVLSGGDDRTVRLWDQHTGKQLHSITHPAAVLAVAWSPDGKWFVSGGADGIVRRWDAKSGKELNRFEGHQGPVQAVAVARDGNAILSGGGDRTVRLWDIAKGSQLQVLKGHANSVVQVAFTSDGWFALSGASQYGQADPAVRQWDLQKGNEMQRWGAGFQGGVTAVAFSHDGRLALSGGSGSALKLWKIGE